MSSAKLVLGVVAGVAAGALLGVLFAPDEGSKTRRKIVEKGEDYADALKEKVDGILEVASQKLESIKHDAGALFAKGKTKLEETASNHVENIIA